MLLAVDVGNTNIVFGVHEGEGWLHHWRVRTVRDKMSDEYGVLFRGLLRESGLEPATFHQVVLGSVVPPLTNAIREMLEAQTGCAPLIVNHAVHTGLSFDRLRNPAEVGADLICDAVALHARYPERAAVVVDFGTATTFTGVSGQGEMLGVAIAPGMNLAAAALAGSAAQLPQIDLKPPPRILGTDTITAIQSGILFGYVSLVEGMIGRIRDEMGEEAPAVATGGLSRLVVPLTRHFVDVDPWLTLEGLRLIAGQNR
jgi:type III pantothenate kinase